MSIVGKPEASRRSLAVAPVRLNLARVIGVRLVTTNLDDDEAHHWFLWRADGLVEA